LNILTVDFETYYSKDFGFKTHTTEEYVRGDEFEVIGVGVALNDDPATWFSGTDKEVAAFLSQYDWANLFVLAHNTIFDGAILSWRYGVKPKGWLDTLCMARAIHGVDAGGSLQALAERYNIGVKGTEVANALGLRRGDFPAEQLAKYGEYCKNDVEITRTLFYKLMDDFPVKELKVIDCTLRMFIDPVLTLNLPMLESHLENVKDRKAKLLLAAEADKDSLMSSDKFAELLVKLGVVPPIKISARTGKQAYAFAKTDEGFKALLEHPDPRVQTLVSARLGNKTTLEETRTQRFIDIALRGRLPVPIKYYAAHTGRWGGDDKINLQNLPSRGANGGKLKQAIQAPEGWAIIDSDSSQIEARTVAWLAGQNDLVAAFDRGEDVYKIMASAIYNKPISDVTKQERFIGKTVILGCGYGMGAAKLQVQLLTFGVDTALDECKGIIKVYRDTYPEIPKLWKQGQACLEAIITGNYSSFGAVDVVRFDPVQSGFLLPSGLWQRYDGLAKEDDPNGYAQYTYKTRMGPTKIYGGKLVENICQAVARCVIAEQMLRIAKRYRVVLTVHDAVASVAPEAEAQEAQKYVEYCMRWRPDWCKTLPLNCESGMGRSYGEC
jgi:DNA polymerase